KIVAAIGMGRLDGDRLTVGVGMIPRGEVGLIFATLGFRNGVLGRDLYAALLLVILATTVLTPPLLRARMQWLRVRQRRRSTVEHAPLGGWLWVDGDLVELAAN